MTSQSKTRFERAEIVDLLTEISDTFGPKSQSFRVFGSYEGVSDLIFKDTTTALVKIPDDDDTNPMAFLGDYGQLAENLDPHRCKEKSAASPFPSPISPFYFIIFYLMLWVATHS